MTTAYGMTEAEIAQVPPLDKFEYYLVCRGGKEVLEFDDSTKAQEAIRALRVRHPNVRFTASYNKVTAVL